MSTCPRWSGSKLPGIRTVVICPETVTLAAVLLLHSLEERDPGSAVALAPRRLPARHIEPVERAPGLGHDERGPCRRQQARPLVELVRRIGEHDVDVEPARLAERVARHDSAA